MSQRQTLFIISSMTAEVIRRLETGAAAGTNVVVQLPASAGNSCTDRSAAELQLSTPGLLSRPGRTMRAFVPSNPIEIYDWQACRCAENARHLPEVNEGRRAECSLREKGRFYWGLQRWCW